MLSNVDNRGICTKRGIHHCTTHAIRTSELQRERNYLFLDTIFNLKDARCPRRCMCTAFGEKSKILGSCKIERHHLAKPPIGHVPDYLGYGYSPHLSQILPVCCFISHHRTSALVSLKLLPNDASSTNVVLWTLSTRQRGVPINACLFCCGRQESCYISSPWLERLSLITQRPNALGTLGAYMIVSSQLQSSWVPDNHFHLCPLW
jgi:hypothetical protein